MQGCLPGHRVFLASQPQTSQHSFLLQESASLIEHCYHIATMCLSTLISDRFLCCRNQWFAVCSLHLVCI